MSELLRLGLTGDVMLGRKVDEVQRRREPAAVWGEVRERLRGLDGLVINLECCLSTRGERWTRTHRPFHFRADPDWALPALDAAGVDCCALANNHLLDFEVPALEDTLEFLDAADIARSGAGMDLDEALEPGTFSVGPLKVAVVSLTDNTPEFAASADQPGVARVEFDVTDEAFRETVSGALGRAAATDPDLLVASLHWGPNMVEEPPQEFIEAGHWLVEEGVDLVHGHSAHVFQGIEVYDGVPICYDTGDFVDDYAVDPDLRNDRSFLFEVRVSPDGDLDSLKLRPTQIDRCQVNWADERAATWSRERMRALSAPFGTEFERENESLVLEL